MSQKVTRNIYFKVAHVLYIASKIIEITTSCNYLTILSVILCLYEYYFNVFSPKILYILCASRFPAKNNIPYSFRVFRLNLNVKFCLCISGDGNFFTVIIS